MTRNLLKPSKESRDNLLKCCIQRTPIAYQWMNWAYYITGKDGWVRYGSPVKLEHTNVLYEALTNYWEEQ